MWGAQEWALSESDLDDLVSRVREEGTDTRVVEAVKDALLNGEALAPADTQGLKRRAIVYALHYGGKALDCLLRHLSEQAAEYVRQHAGRLAGYLDHAAVWTLRKIVQFLGASGVPRSCALEAGGKVLELAA